MTSAPRSPGARVSGLPPPAQSSSSAAMCRSQPPGTTTGRSDTSGRRPATSRRTSICRQPPSVLARRRWARTAMRPWLSSCSCRKAGSRCTSFLSAYRSRNGRQGAPAIAVVASYQLLPLPFICTANHQFLRVPLRFSGGMPRAPLMRLPKPWMLPGARGVVFGASVVLQHARFRASRR